MECSALRRLFLPLAVLLPLALFSLSCGDDDGPASPPANPTVPTSPTVPGTPTPTPPAPGAVLAETLARSPQLFIYIAGKGETTATVASAFGVNADQVKSLNQLTSDAISDGQALAIPLVLPGTLSFIPDSTIETFLGVGGKAGKLVLLQPGLAMREGYLGRLALHRVRLADGAPVDEGFGYVTDYFFTDRPPGKGGVPDPETRIAGPALSVAAGSLATSLKSETPGDLYTFTRDSVTYTVKAFPDAKKSAQELAAMLQTAKDR